METEDVKTVHISDQDEADANALLARLDGIESALDEIIRKNNDRRISLYGGDNILDAIPRKFRPLVERVEQTRTSPSYNDMTTQHGLALQPSSPDPVVAVGMGAWLRGHLMKLSQPGNFDREAHEKLTQALGGINKVALQEDTASEGGNLVPVVVEGEVLRLIADNSVLRPLVRKVPMTTKTHAYPTRAAAFSAAIIAEEGSITDSVPSSPFSQSSLTAKKLACFATVAGELMQDNVVLLADYLATEFAEQIGRLEDTQALEGDGTGVNFTGVVAASGTGSVFSGTNGDFLSYQKLVRTIYTGGEASSRDGGMFFWNPQIEESIVRTRLDQITAADAAGVPIWAPAAGVMGSPGQSLLGRPFKSLSGILKNRTNGTGTNQTNIYFGPPRTIIFGDRLGFTVDLNPWGKFQSFQIDIRGLKRTGILVGVPAAWTVYSRIDGSGNVAK
jgi:HK97 family phage major capsid protein